MINKISKKKLPAGFDIEGHRGCRGLLPENSIPAFLKALELEVTTLEMDIVISKDKKVVVSHDPYFSHEFSLTPSKQEISAEEERNFKIYGMNYAEVKKFKTGSKTHSKFPKQKKAEAYKPLLAEVIQIIELQTKKRGQKPVWYNIEIKSNPEGDSVFHPDPEEFTDLVYSIIKEYDIIDRTIIQCFDLRPLQYLRKRYPAIKLSLLIENNLSPEFNIRILGFTPDIYSPQYLLVNKTLIDFAKSCRMKVIPWTVNHADDILNLINLGVDGVITDYPDLFE